MFSIIFIFELKGEFFIFQKKILEDKNLHKQTNSKRDVKWMEEKEISTSLVEI